MVVPRDSWEATWTLDDKSISDAVPAPVLAAVVTRDSGMGNVRLVRRRASSVWREIGEHKEHQP